MGGQWLDLAIDLAVANVAEGGGPFGAVVVLDGQPIGEGVNLVTETLDPTAHAEVVAIRDACRNTGDFALAGAVVYSSCEPCPLCLAATLWARVDRISFAATRVDAEIAGFDDARFHSTFSAEPSAWQRKLDQVPHPRSFEPFDAWLADANRVAY
jgi:guanine deaminase